VSIKKKVLPPQEETTAHQTKKQNDEQQEAPKQSNTSDRTLRLMQVLTPKPIKDVKNWGIPDEPATPCDPDRAVSFLVIKHARYINTHTHKIGTNCTFPLTKTLRTTTERPPLTQQIISQPTHLHQARRIYRGR
jgi:hypothetical protein